jgi:hypothetical protein
MSGIIGTSHSKSGVIGRSKDTAKAWCDFNGTGTPAKNGSFNISSITTPTTGHFIVNFINPMKDSNYTVVGGGTGEGSATGGDQQVISFGAKTTANFYVEVRYHVSSSSASGALYDYSQNSFAVFGD